MKILNISYDARLDSFDGGRIHTFSLATKLADFSNIDLIVRAGKNTKLSISKKNSLTIHALPFIDIQKFNIFKKLYYISYNNFKLVKYILNNKANYDIVYERHNLNMIAGLIYSKFVRIPLIYEVNGIPDEDAVIVYGIRSNLLKYILRTFATIQLRLAAAIIVQTKELKDIISTRYKCHNVFIVENGIDIPKNIYNKKYNSQPKFVFVGSLDKSHDPSPVLKALIKSKKNFIMNIVGDGALYPNLKQEFGKDKRISFIGKTSHEVALSYIAESDVCIVHYSNDYEEFKKYGFYYCPIKLFEYASFNKPVIVIGYANTIIKRFKNEGACVVYKNCLDFEKEIFKLIKNKRILNLMGNRAGKLVQNYTWEKAANKTFKIFQNNISFN